MTYLSAVTRGYTLTSYWLFLRFSFALRCKVSFLKFYYLSAVIWHVVWLLSMCAHIHVVNTVSIVNIVNAVNALKAVKTVGTVHVPLKSCTDTHLFVPTPG